MSGLGIFAVWAFAMAAGQQPATAADSVLMVAHWRCQVWSGMAGEEDRFLAHHDSGILAGRRFVEAVRAGGITPQDVDATVPIFVALSLEGPSDEFVLGRLYEITTTDAYDQVVRRDANGSLRAPQDYVMDNELRAALARVLIRTHNCSLLRS
jgi:hypothetical protein